MDKLHGFDNAVGTVVLDTAEFFKAYRWDGAALIIGGVPPRWLVVIQSYLPPIAAVLVVAAVESWRRLTQRTMTAAAPA